MYEWSVPIDTPIDDLEAFKAANPASWIRIPDLEELREGLPEHDFKMLHGNIWIDSKNPWLPGGAWQDCAAEYEIDPGERIFVGVDVGGARSDSAVVWVTEDLRLGCEIFSGESSVLDVADCVNELAERFRIVELLGDPFRLARASSGCASAVLRSAPTPPTTAA